MNNPGIHWFDSVFDADDIHSEYPDPRRWTMTIEQTTEWAKAEDQQWSQPTTFVEAYKQTHLTEPPF